MTEQEQFEGLRTIDKPGVPVLAANSNGKLLNEKELRDLDKHIKQNYQPEQPNTNRVK